MSMVPALVLAFLLAGPEAATSPAAPTAAAFEAPADVTSPNKIDEVVFARLKQANVQPAALCSDGVFVRRVFLDVIGTLPTAQEATDFLADKNPDKRRLLIDRVLDRPEYADYWALKWCDVLRVKGEFPINLWPNAAQAYHRWIRTCMAENRPYDAFVRDLLTSSGSNFRKPAVNFYRALQEKDPQGLAKIVALTLLCQRAEKWPKEKLAGLSGFFAQVGYKSTREWKEEIVFWDLDKAAKLAAEPKPPVALYPDGSQATLTMDKDPRQVFADWLIRPENSQFNAAVANRVWTWLVGRGVVHEVDDLRADNPPVNPELLALLEKELVAARYDLKQLMRLILNSRTYQLSSIPRTRTPEASALFAHYPVRRLEAEVLIDALCIITGTGERYSSETPEPFTFIPEKNRTIQLADGSVTSPFLEMFGRPPRDTGMDAERNPKPTPSQRLHMLNSSHVLNKIDRGPRLQALLLADEPPEAIARKLYLTILSRLPSDDELKRVMTYNQSKVVKGREGLLDLAWALFNTEEFLYRH